jgi:Na+-driven multidrug efflux pump
MLRQGVCLLPVIWVLPYFMNDKGLAIWLSMPVSDVVCNAMTLIPLYAHIKFLRAASCARERIKPQSRSVFSPELV